MGLSGFAYLVDVEYESFSHGLGEKGSHSADSLQDGHGDRKHQGLAAQGPADGFPNGGPVMITLAGHEKSRLIVTFPPGCQKNATNKVIHVNKIDSLASWAGHEVKTQ
jgi:hypothetical protein